MRFLLLLLRVLNVPRGRTGAGMFAIHIKIIARIIGIIESSFGFLRAGEVDRDSVERVEEFCYCRVAGGVSVGRVVIGV